MSRCWVIAPFESKSPEAFDKVWQFDVANNLISIGWSELGDVSKMSREQLATAMTSAYPTSPPATKSLFANMLWAFYHEIVPGDLVIARKGRKALVGVGKVIQSAVYAPGKNPAIQHPNFLAVAWQEQPRDKAFPSLVFPMHTLTDISENQYRSLVDASGIPPVIISEPAEEIDQAFLLEKYLEDFIVSNFGPIFKGKLRIFEDAEGGESVGGQQYRTDIGKIDILAVENDSSSFVVIELKKDQGSDQVIGQILRYMGWVKKNLCKDGQGVKGLVICRDPDPRLSYALEMTQDIDVRYFSVSFTLREAP